MKNVFVSHQLWPIIHENPYKWYLEVKSVIKLFAIKCLPKGSLKKYCKILGGDYKPPLDHRFVAAGG